MVLWLTLLGFFLGSLPFSVWLTRWIAHRDVRSVGDGNPGATNALRAGGRALGLLVMFLDVSKAAVPLGLAYQTFGLRGWELLPIAAAPTLGHGYSPFLGFRGGKALATMLGVWIGLTLWEMPAVLLVSIVLFYALLTVDGWAALITTLVGLGYLLLFRPDPAFLGVMAFQIAFVILRHRADLRRRPGLRAWALRLLGRKP